MLRLNLRLEITFQCPAAGEPGPAAVHAAAEPSVAATAQVKLRGAEATAEDVTPTTEGCNSLANFQAGKEID